MLILNTELLTKPRIIDEKGEYVPRCGDAVTIDNMSEKRWQGYKFCWGVYSDGRREMWDESGRILPNSETKNDIVRKKDTKEA